MEAAGKDGKAPQERTAKRKRSTGHNPEDCPVCMTVYDDTVQRPCTLPCGHTVCTVCVNKLTKQGHVACPECCFRHAVPEGMQFPICYALEAFIRKTKDAEAAASASPPPSFGTGKRVAAAAGQKEAAGLSRKMLSFLQEQEASVLAVIKACQEVQDQLDQYKTTLRDWGEQQQQLEERLQGLLDESKSARELVQQEESRVAAKKKAAKKRERQLHVALDSLRTPAAEQKERLAIAEVLRCTDEAEQLLEECQGIISDAKTVTTVRKVKEASNAALEAFQATLKAFQVSVAEEEARPQSEAECSIKDRQQAILTPSLKKPLQVQNPHTPTQAVISLVMYGVHQVEGQLRHARISLMAGKLHLHPCKEGTPNPKVSLVVRPNPPCVVFLDLSWPGSALRRVHVRLSQDTPHGRQMVLLCTGQRGPSYAGTRLFKVRDKGEPGECVFGGDYESNDGKGGAALLPDLNKGDYRESGKAGAVGAWCSTSKPCRGAQFGITTRDFQSGRGLNVVFGEVVLGLDAVVAAAQHTPITDVTIMDCGVVLWG